MRLWTLDALERLADGELESVVEHANGLHPRRDRR
jgi:hypothetical protein